MSKLIRNTSDQEGREFWESVEKAAAEIDGAPRWMKAGISLNAQHLQTYAARPSDARDRDEHSPGDE